MCNYRLLLVSLVVLVNPIAAVAQTWDGGGADDNFSTAANWNPNGVPANNGTANLTFDGAMRLSPDVNVNFNVNGVAFAPTAGPFAIQRANNSTLTVQAGGVTNNDAGLQTFDVPVNFGANSAINAAAGPVTFRGDTGLGTAAVTVGGNFDVSFANFMAITGTGSLTKNTNNTFSISSDGSVQNYDLTLNAGAVNFSGSGPVFGSNAAIMLNGGTMTVNSILTLALRNGANFTRTAAATLTLGAGMSIESDGDATFQGPYVTALDALYRVTGTGSTLTAADLEVRNDARLEVLSGGLASMQTRFMVGSITDGTAVVDGGTLNASAVTFTPVIGASGGTGALTVRNSGMADYTSRTLAIGSAGTGTLLVERDGDMVVGQFLVGIGGSGGGTVTVTGVGSTLRTNQASNSELGMASGTTATVNLEDGGELNLTGGLNIRRTGVVNINGGILTMAPTRRITNEGVLNFNAGRITMGESLGVGAFNSLLGVNLTLTPGREVDIGSPGGAVTVASPGSLVIDGGVLRTSQLINQGGTIDLRRGTLAITGPGTFNIGSTGPLGANVTVGPATTLSVDDATVAVAAGGTLDVAGGDFSAEALLNNGAVLVESGTATIRVGASNATGGQMLIGRTLTLGGTLTNGARLELAGGAARIDGTGALANNGLITGHGTINTPVNNNAPGEIRGEDGKTLTLNGALGANTGTINLRGGQIDFAQAVTNSATGQINGRGALSFAGGLTNEGQMQFSGGPTDIYGNVSFTGGVGGGEMINSGAANVVTFYGNVVHNGDEIRTSPTNTTVFFGNVSGAGPFTGTGAVRFEGMFTPGNSPGRVALEGDMHLGADAVLAMELGGAAAGAHYDQLQIEGLLSLDGLLDVTLLDGFAPRYGDAFDLLDFGALSGRFDAINLPALDGGLAWDTTALYSSGTITAVPEPASILLACAGLACLGWRNRRLARTIHARGAL